MSEKDGQTVPVPEDRKTITLTFLANPEEFATAKAALFEQTVFGECIEIGGRDDR